MGEINQIIMDELVLILILAGCSFQHFIAKEMRTIVFENNSHGTVKFIYSEKATKFCQISTVDLSYVVPVKSTVEISQKYVVFSECINFTNLQIKGTLCNKTQLTISKNSSLQP